jgi:hypothetical protein
MEIRFSSDVPDSTYFRTGDVEPAIEDNGLTLYDGSGSRRSWGQPGVTSTVVVSAPDFVAVHVGFHHKHGGGQFWRFYNVNGQIEQVAWKDLSDETRQVVLEANAPSWARVPGKLRKDYIKPAPRKFSAFKIVRIADDKLLSLYDSTEYQIGKTKIEKARPDHRGGYYVYTGDDVKARFLAGQIGRKTDGQQYALVACECWGNAEYYDWEGSCISHYMENGYYGYPTESVHKISVTYCKPTEIIETFEV